MGGKAVWSAVAVAAVLSLPATVSAQMPSWQDVQLRDIETMKTKFAGLAEAFDESQYDWRPMEGVRSVRQVLGLAIAEANLFPTGWGFDAPEGAASGFGPELERAAGLSKAEMIAQINSSFDFLLDCVGSMDEETRMSESSFFGTKMPMHANIATAMSDMHEHLGQAIAYARTNKVVPPWSRKDGM
jgi:DinB superfamily